MSSSTESEGPSTRRKFLKLLGASAPGLALAGSIEAVKEKAKVGSEDIQKELQEIRDGYELLDRKTKFMIRLFLAFTGLDIFSNINFPICDAKCHD